MLLFLLLLVLTNTLIFLLNQLDQKQPENRDTNLITKSKRFETGPLDLWPQQQRQQRQHQQQKHLDFPVVFSRLDGVHHRSYACHVLRVLTHGHQIWNV